MREWSHGIGKGKQYSTEVRERAVRLVRDHEAECPSQWAAINSVAQKIGCSGETLHSWIRQAEQHEGKWPALTTEERQRLKELLAAGAQECDRPCPDFRILVGQQRFQNRRAQSEEAA